MFRITCITVCLITLVGCQSQPLKPMVQPKTISQEITKPKEIQTSTGVVIKPYELEEIQRKQVPIIAPQAQ